MRVYLNAQLVFISLLLSFQALGQNKDPYQLEVIPDHIAYLYAPPENIKNEDIQYQLYAQKRRWENGRSLRVCFFNANPVVAKLIRTVAVEWNQHSGVVFDFGPENKWLNCLSPQVGLPEIRIGFSERGYWSYVGSDSERYGGERSPSMNFDSFNRIYNEIKYTLENVIEKADPYHKATIRHEFGHALGLLHEHQNPNLSCYNEIKWKGSGNVYEILGGAPNFWSKEQVDRNLGYVRATDPDYIAQDPDPNSIMMYSLSPSIFTDGYSSKCATPVNYQISNKDKLIVSKIYSTDGQNQSVAAISEAIDSSFVKPVPQFLDQGEKIDFLNRVIVDLESDDTATRRNARTRLSQMLILTDNFKEVDRLILNLPDSSYRIKLGVSVALKNANRKVEVSSSAAKIINQMLTSEKDPVLKSNLTSARKSLLIQ